MKNNSTKVFLNIVMYFFAFIAIQLLATFATKLIWLLTQGVGGDPLMRDLQDSRIELHSTIIIISSVASSVITILLFAWLKWSPVTRSYIKSRPWVTLFWVVILTLGTIIPATWAEEQLNLSMPSNLEQLFAGIMSERWGYLAIGILIPVAEEMVFRGAIQRMLQRVFSKNHWLAIVVSALIFGAVHGNLPQFIHAFLLGLLLGWMYYRTDSVVPGIVLHWVNNTFVFVIYNLVPGISNMKLAQLFDGQERYVWMSIAFSLCLFFPALLQLAIRLKKKDKNS